MANRPSPAQIIHNRAPQALGALFVVGLGMLLIAGLSGIVLWIVTRQRVSVHRVPPSDLGHAEPAEA